MLSGIQARASLNSCRARTSTPRNPRSSTERAAPEHEQDCSRCCTSRTATFMSSRPRARSASTMGCAVAANFQYLPPPLLPVPPPSRLLLLVPPPSTPLQLTSGTGTPATHALQLNVLRLNTNSATTGNAQVHETREHRLVRSRARAVVLLTRWGWFAQGTRAWVGVALHQALSTSSLIFTVMRTRILDKCATALL